MTSVVLLGTPITEWIRNRPGGTRRRLCMIDDWAMEYGKAVIVDRLASQKLEPDTSAIYDREIALKLLHRDPKTGAPHYLIRYPAGLGSKPHRHAAAHTIVVLEGRMEVNGQIVGPGSYCHFPAGEVMRHAPADGESCLFVIMFDGPVDAQPVVA